MRSAGPPRSERYSPGPRPTWQAPPPEHPERRALPLHLRPVAAALFDRLPDPPGDAVVDAAVGRLAEGRRRLAALLPAGSEVSVDAHQVRLAAACAASVIPSGKEFRWTPASAARYLGLRAVALHLCGSTDDPVEVAVEAVLDELGRGGGDRTPGPWLADLHPAARAVACAQARRWAEQAVAWLPLRLVGARSLHFLDDDWWPRSTPDGRRSGRTLVLHGRRDLTVEVGLRRVAVTLAPGLAAAVGAADVDALCALAATLCDAKGRLVRVVRVHPASGEVVATDVTPELLDRGVDAVLATASARAAAQAGATPSTNPGPGCTWCDRLGACSPGTAWLRRPDRRSMGLPPPPPPRPPAHRVPTTAPAAPTGCRVPTTAPAVPTAEPARRRDPTAAPAAPTAPAGRRDSTTARAAPTAEPASCRVPAAAPAVAAAPVEDRP